jgi:predicted MFS family arabinose efflux permease
MAMPRSTRLFYRFLGLHSFLIGLFPFFIPVFLWKHDYSLVQISSFIAMTGAGFLLTLWLWDRAHKTLPLNTLIAASFLVETALLALIFMQGQPGFLPLFALLNGAYNCFFWITQRALFFETLGEKDTGKRFGNFQVVVVIIIKMGVLFGGLLLDKAGYLSVFLLSALIGLLGILSFFLLKEPMELPRALRDDAPLSLKEILGFHDPHRSRPVFLLDGPFLFLESYFWVISLFLLAHESFWKLGALVILLGAGFSALFFLIKNRIDHMPVQRIYAIAVAGYSLSWFMRTTVDDGLPLGWLFATLLIITFCTSFFRLAFNKRFFDLAQKTSAHRYLFLKSYYSQFSIALGFALGALASAASQGDSATLLHFSYLLAGAFAPLFFLYRPHPDRACAGSAP